jgi:hypothetical protein
MRHSSPWPRACTRHAARRPSVPKKESRPQNCFQSAVGGRCWAHMSDAGWEPPLGQPARSPATALGTPADQPTESRRVELDYLPRSHPALLFAPRRRQDVRPADNGPQHTANNKGRPCRHLGRAHGGVGEANGFEKPINSSVRPCRVWHLVVDAILAQRECGSILAILCACEASIGCMHGCGRSVRRTFQPATSCPSRQHHSPTRRDIAHLPPIITMPSQTRIRYFSAACVALNCLTAGCKLPS